MTWSLRERWFLCLLAIFSAGVRVRLTETFALVPLAPSSTAADTRYNRRPHLFEVDHLTQPLWHQRCRESEVMLNALHEPATAAAESSSSWAKSNSLAVEIKPAKFPDLGAVSRLLVEEFYGVGLWFPAQCLVELRRLQDNFHSYEKDADLHLMLVATVIEDGRLAGFVDVDARERRADNGGYRPYLSDLAVAGRFRRLGVGTKLVRACEDACVSWGFDSLYLKVNTGNLAAERLYGNLGYVKHDPKNSKNEVTLRGSLLERSARAAPRGGDAVQQEG